MILERAFLILSHLMSSFCPSKKETKEPKLPTIGTEWIPWDGNYVKEFYDIKLHDGKVLRNCWPNAGRMHDLHGNGRQYRKEDVAAIRVAEQKDFPWERR